MAYWVSEEDLKGLKKQNTMNQEMTLKEIIVLYWRCFTRRETPK